MHYAKEVLTGPWRRGYALSHHKSGYRDIPTRYTNVADLLLQAKKGNDPFIKLVEAIRSALSSKIFPDLHNYDFMIPIPPSMRMGPPAPGDLVYDLAYESCIGTKSEVCTCLHATRIAQSLKYSREIEHKILARRGLYKLVKPESVNGKNILIFDDVCNTGTTLKEAFNEIDANCNANRIDVFTVTVSGGIDKRNIEDAAQDELEDIFSGCPEDEYGNVYVSNDFSFRRKNPNSYE